MKSAIAPALQRYLLLAVFLSVLSLVPGLLYWFFSGFTIGTRVFLAFFTVSQIAAGWIYREPIGEAIRRREKP